MVIEKTIRIPTESLEVSLSPWSTFRIRGRALNPGRIASSLAFPISFHFWGITLLSTCFTGLFNRQHFQVVQPTLSPKTSFSLTPLAFRTLKMYPWLHSSSWAALATLRCFLRHSQMFLSGIFNDFRPKPLTTTDLPQWGQGIIIVFAVPSLLINRSYLLTRCPYLPLRYLSGSVDFSRSLFAWRYGF